MSGTVQLASTCKDVLCSGIVGKCEMPDNLTKFATPQVSGPPVAREVVVLVHGLAASRTLLKPLEWHLRQGGYETLNWGYPSIRGEIASLSESFSQRLRELCEDSTTHRFHLVTHSMGSIIARAALANAKFGRLGRVVMLGPPHGGSRVATNLSSVLGWLCKPLTQLSDRPDSFVNTLAEPVGHEVGIIAAARDRVVCIESTCLSRQTDHIIVDSGHTSMLFRRDVWHLVETFLHRGRFERQLRPYVAHPFPEQSSKIRRRRRQFPTALIRGAHEHRDC